MAENKEELLPLNSFIGKKGYKVVGLLGQGGFGAVYLVQEPGDNVIYRALKELSDKFQTQEEQVYVEHMFYREVELLASLKHHGIPGITDFFIENSRLYVVMEFIQGVTLADFIESGKYPPEEEIIELIFQLAEVLDYLHSQKPRPIIFRDIKPANIMIGEDNKVYLIDFGLARLFDAGKKQDTIICLSQGYAPPEQYPVESGIPGALGKTDVRSDIYALGATLHHLITGRDPRVKPFYFPSIRELNQEMSEGLAKIIARSVAYDPSKRFPSVKKLTEELFILLKKTNFKSRREEMLTACLKYEEEGNFEEALFLYKELIEIEPEDATVYYKIGLCYDKMGLSEMAEKYLSSYRHIDQERTENLCPYCKEIITVRVNYCTNCKNPVKVCSDCNVFNRESARFCRVCGSQKFEQEIVEKKNYAPLSIRLNIKLYQDAIKLCPEEKELFLGLGETYEALGKPLKALKYYKEFVSSVEEHPEKFFIINKIQELQKGTDSTIIDNRNWLAEPSSS